MMKGKFQSRIPEAKRRIRDGMKAGLSVVGEVGLGEIVVRTPVDTGELRSGYSYEVTGDENNPGVVWGTNVEHAPYVDLGTSKMPAQPHFKQTIESNIGKLRQVMGEAMKR